MEAQASQTQGAEAAPISPNPTEGEFTIDQPITADDPDFITILKTINILPDGTMRWNFEFWNKTGVTRALYFTKASYVVDELGNRYAVVKELAINPQTGERVIQSVEFEEPKPGATVFTLYWNAGSGVGFQNPVIAVPIILNSDPTPQPTPTPADTIGINQAIQADAPDFLVNLISVQLLPTKTMRWNFEFWNKTGVTRALYFTKASYVVDELGNRYAVVKELAINPQTGERVIQSVEFEEPKPGATVFTLYWNAGSGVGFQNPVISVAFSTQSSP